MSRPAVFLDRDGTLIEERGYLDRLQLLEVLPWSPDAIRLLNRAGYVTVVITNQSAIGRGIIDEPFLHEVHAALDTRLAAGRARRPWQVKPRRVSELECSAYSVPRPASLSRSAISSGASSTI